MTSLARRVAEQVRGVGKSSEWRRIAALPRRVLNLATVPDLTRVWLIDPSDCTGCDLCRDADGERIQPRLLPIQSAALFEAEQYGLFAPIAVGGGKTLTALLLPDAMEAKRAVYLVKPRLRDQLIKSDIPRYGRHFRLPLDRFTVVAYTELSSASGADVLDRLQPDLVIADEAHAFRHATAARTKRFVRCMDDDPGRRFVPLSGTMATRGVRDYWHLADYSLRSSSPVPRSWREVEDWARGLDEPEKIEGRTPLAPGALLHLCGEEEREKQVQAVLDESRSDDVYDSSATAREVARRIFRTRLVETPGVISVPDADVDCSLTISARTIEVPAVVHNALEELRKVWSIAGEELRDAKDVYRYARQLACGFFYRWAWPDGRPDFEWLEARANWRAAVRKVLSRSRAGLDSPLLVAKAAQRGEVHEDVLAAWVAWSRVMDRPPPPVEPVWLHDHFLFDDVLAWCERCEKDSAPGIVWYKHLAVEARLRTIGVPMAVDLGDALDRSREPFVALSLDAHTEGYNMQHHYCRNLVLSAPANPRLWEQFLGRTHRRGQRADEVEVEVYQHDASLRSAFAKALDLARGLQSREGQRQRLCYATRIGFE